MEKSLSVVGCAISLKLHSCAFADESATHAEAQLKHASNEEVKVIRKSCLGRSGRQHRFQLYPFQDDVCKS